MDKQLGQAINQFVKWAVNHGILKSEDMDDYIIYFKREVDDYAIGLVRKDNDDKIYDFSFKFPELPKDKTDAMIDLAGYISRQITEWPIRQQRSKAGKASASKLTPEQRSARARKAARAKKRKNE